MFNITICAREKTHMGLDELRHERGVFADIGKKEFAVILGGSGVSS
jgi:hypothetical protein